MVFWVKLWSVQVFKGGVFVYNVVSKWQYFGVNVVLFWMVQDEGGYSVNWWFIFKQVKEVGGIVCKGEKGIMIVFVFYMECEDEKIGEFVCILFLKCYIVFNVE